MMIRLILIFSLLSLFSCKEKDGLQETKISSDQNPGVCSPKNFSPEQKSCKAN